MFRVTINMLSIPNRNLVFYRRPVTVLDFQSNCTYVYRRRVGKNGAGEKYNYTGEKRKEETNERSDTRNRSVRVVQCTRARTQADVLYTRIHRRHPFESAVTLCRPVKAFL